MIKYKVLTFVLALELLQAKYHPMIQYCVESLQNEASLFKMTKINCVSHNASWVKINHCRVRPVSRYVSELNLNITFIHPAYNIDVNVLVLKRANGYKPFLTNVTLDACEFYRKRNHPIGNMIYKSFVEFSNVNHSCPYVGDQILKGYYLKSKILNNLPVPTGEYALFLTWSFDKQKMMNTNVYFIYEE